ncbi:MAG: sortase [Lachnospiraceae bacterium]|nr:sortase [Lachnospiraceae bacterium]
MSEKKWKAPLSDPQKEQNDDSELWSRVSQADLLKASGAGSSKNEEESEDTSLEDIFKLDLSFLNETEDAAILEQARQAKEADPFVEETAEEFGGILHDTEEPVLPPTESASSEIVGRQSAEYGKQAAGSEPDAAGEPSGAYRADFAEKETAGEPSGACRADFAEEETAEASGAYRADFAEAEAAEAVEAQPDGYYAGLTEREILHAAGLHPDEYYADVAEGDGAELVEAEPDALSEAAEEPVRSAAAEDDDAVGAKKKSKKEQRAEEAARREQEARNELLTDEEAYRTKQHKKKLRNFMLNGIMLASTAVFLVCAVELGVYFYQSMRYQASMDELRNSIGGGISGDANSKIENQTQENGDVMIFPDEEAYEVIAATKQDNLGKTWADQYATLVEKNSDCFGYIEIPDTVLSYPVMFTPEDYMYYLDKNIDKEKEKRGLPFMDEATKIGESQNYLVYGHNMNDTTAFGSLREYLDKSYYEEHKYIYFNTAVSEGVYEIMAVVKTKIYNVEDQCFKYHKYGGVLTKSEFETYVSEMTKESIYKTGVTAKWGDELLTLSTCNRYTENGRLVIVAKRIA